MFLFLGIWNVANNQDIVDYVYDELSKRTCVDEICNSLIHHCLNLRSLDNMSVIVIGLLLGKSENQFYDQFSSHSEPLLNPEESMKANDKIE